MNHWKRTAAGIFAAAILYSVLPANTPVRDLFSGIELTANAETNHSGECGTNVTWTLDEEGTLTVSGTGAMANYSGTPDHYSPWYDSRSEIKQIVIANGVTSIGDNAFMLCDNLVSVEIPNSITNIKKYAFFNCSRLESVDIPDSVTSIGRYAFDGCRSLTSVTIPDGVKSIEEYTFYNCSSMASVTIPDSVASIEKYAFYHCSSLTSVTIPKYVTSLGQAAFSDCENLISVTIPDRMINIGDDAFQSCCSLTSVTIPDRVTSIGSGAFLYCSSLTSVIIPDSVESIGQCAFSDCTGLTSVIIPDSLTNIGNSVFFNCQDLTSVIIPDSVTSIDESAFDSCSSLTSVIIPDSVTDIGDYAFMFCESLTSVVLESETPPALGDEAFCDASEDLMIYVPAAAVETYKDKWSAYADRIRSNIIGEWECGADGGNCQAALIANGTLIISGSGAMGDYDDGITPWDDYRTDIKKVVIADGVTDIGNYAFKECSNLTSVDIPNSVTSIGESTFRLCSSLTSVIIPDSVPGIGSYAFYDCTDLTSVILEGNTPPILQSFAFDHTHEDLRIIVPTEADDSYRNAAVWSNYADRILPLTLEEWNCGEKGDNCKAALSAFGTFTISGSGKMLDYDSEDDSPWSDYSSDIQKVVIEDGVNNIGAYAFQNCCNLTSADIPDSVTGIGRTAFSDCTNLASVNIPGNVTSIGNEAFARCKRLFSIDIPDSVRDIGDYAFHDCVNLTTVSIPESVTGIGQCAFSDCSGLTCVILESDTPPAPAYDLFGNTHDDLKIYVPADTVDVYKETWSDCADKIYAFAVLEEEPCYPLISGEKNKVHVGFSASTPIGFTIEDSGLIFYNSGTVITTPYLTLENVGICGIKKEKYRSANITDNGCGVTAVGFVTFKNLYGMKFTVYTGELGGSFKAMTNAAEYVTLARQGPQAVASDDMNKVYVSFDANVPKGYAVEDYGLIYYNSGNVIHTEHLTLNNVGICGIRKVNSWGSNITDNGYGVTAVGFVTVKDGLGNETTLYTKELGGSFQAISEEAAANAVTLTRRENKAVVSGGKNKVYVGFGANVTEGYTVEDYGLIYYNSGNVIHTEHLTLNNVGVCGIQKATYWGANITDKGYGVVCGGVVKVKDVNGYVTTLYTEELGGSFAALSAEAEANAANAVTLTRHANKAVTANGKNKVYCGFTANVPAGYSVEDYGLIYYNSGNVIHTEHLTLENVGVCGIQKAKYWGANITDKGYGVVCVGFVKVKDANGYVTTLYTEELGAKYSDLVQ